MLAENALVDVSAMADFFSSLYPDKVWPGNLQIIIREPYTTEDGKKKSKTINCIPITKIEDVRALAPAALNIYQSNGFDFFYTCGFNFANNTPKVEDICGISFLWADVDHINEEEMQNRLRGVPLAPSIIVSSGGGYHLYWLLDGYYTVDPELESALKRVAKWVGGDHTQNVNRLLRVAGTWNYGKNKGYENPRECKVVSQLPARYALAEFSKTTLTYSQINLPDNFKERYILNGEVIGDGERSTRDFAIIKELLIAGHSDEDITAIFENPKYGCSTKAIERKGTNYLKETIKKAKTEVASVHKQAVCDDGVKVIKRGMTSKGILVEEIIGNFALKLQRNVQIVDTTTELIEGQVIYRDRVKPFMLPANEFASWRRFIEAVEMQGPSWLGNEVDWQTYRFWLFDRDLEQYKGTNVTGWHGNTFVTQDKIFFGDDIRFFRHQTTPPMVKITENYDVATLVPALFEQIENLRAHIGFPAFGWMAACAYAPHVRKACNDAFPPLVLEGQPGSGKTTLANTFTQTLLGVRESYSIRATEALMKRTLAGTNVYPFFMDEYEPNHRNNFDALIRLAYTGQAAPTATDIVHLPMLGPILLGTSEGVEDEAIIDRAMILRLPELEDEDKNTGQAAINFFRLLPDGAFLYWWLQQEPKWLDEIPRLRALVKSYNLRPQIAFATCMAPLLQLFPNRITDKMMLDWWEMNHGMIVRISPNDALDIAISEAFRTGRLLQVTDWQVDKNDPEWVRIHAKRLIDEILMLPKEIDVAQKGIRSRKWVLKTLHESKFVKDWQKLKRIGDGKSTGKLVASVTLNWKNMSLLSEALEEKLL